MDKKQLPARDDSVRQKFAVGVSLDSQRDTIRILFDDLISMPGSATEWRKWAFYTVIDLPEKDFMDHQLNEEQYAAVGKMLLARLAALRFVMETHEE